MLLNIFITYCTYRSMQGLIWWSLYGLWNKVRSLVVRFENNKSKTNTLQITLWATLSLAIMAQYVQGDSWVKIMKTYFLMYSIRFTKSTLKTHFSLEIVWSGSFGKLDVFGVSESSESRIAGSNLACATALQIFDFYM